MQRERPLPQWNRRSGELASEQTGEPVKLKARRPAVLMAASLWTVWVWTSRIFIISGQDDNSTGFLVVHYTLAAISIAFGVAVGWIGWRLRRESN